MVREAIAANIMIARWIPGYLSTSDIMTKQVAGPEYCDKAETLFWTPPFQR